MSNQTLKFFISTLFSLVNTCHGQSVSIVVTDKRPKLQEFQSVSSTSKQIQGELIYAYDNATYGAGGLEWPWTNGVVIHRFSSKQSKGIGYEVFRKSYDFVEGVQWLKDGTVLLRVGPLVSSFDTYELCHWNPANNSVKTIASNLSWKIVQPSPNSRYVAFVRGAQEVPFGQSTSASLHTIDLQTGVEKKWGKAEPLLGSVAWANNDTLLFSLAPSEGERKAMQLGGAATKPLEWKPRIYAASLSTGQMRPLVADAVRPAPSPDGKWLLSFSFHDPSPSITKVTPKTKPDLTLAQTKIQDVLFLLLSRSDGSEARLVRRENRSAPNIVWFPDSSGFALCDTRSTGSVEGTTTLSVTVSRYDLDADRLKSIGIFRYFAPSGTELSEDNRLWRPIDVTRDKHYLMSELTQFETASNNGLMLQRFDLQTGATEVVAHIGSVRGLDWRESSTP